MSSSCDHKEDTIGLAGIVTDGQGWPIYKRLLGVCKVYWCPFLLGVIGSLIVALSDALLIFVVQSIIDKGFVGHDVFFIRWLPYMIIILFVLRASGSFSATYCINRVGRNMVMYFRKSLLSHLIKLPAKEHDRFTSGKLLSLMIYNIEQISSATTDALLTLLREGSLAIGYLSAMVWLDWKLTFFFLITAPLVAWILRYVSHRIRRLSINAQDSLGEVTHIAGEMIKGYQVIRLFGGEGDACKKFATAVRTNRQQELKIVITNTLGVVIPQIIAILPIAAILYWVTRTHSGLSAGSLVAFMLAMLRLLNPLQRLAKINAVIQKGIAAASSIFSLLDRPIESDQGQHTVKRVKGHITLNKVSFQYPYMENPVLNNISFSIEPGQTIALVGQSGVGKTTIVNLLLRFYEIERGSILIDGINIKDYKLSNLRTQFSMVSQNIILFNTSIEANIAYGLRGVRHEQVVDVARKAHILPFIESLPDGFNTQIGENGVMLSGGQKQRLALARALIKGAPILLLDEATAALDSESEWYVQDALLKHMKYCTTIVIAHRLSTVERADCIFVIDKGGIVETGNHQDLLQKQGYYAAKFCTMQFDGENNKERVHAVEQAVSSD